MNKYILVLMGALLMLFNRGIAQFSEIENELFLLGNAPSLFLKGKTSSGFNGFRIHKSGNNAFFDHRGTGDVFFRLDNIAASTIRMTLKADGKVGIGTTNPLRQLEVNNAMKFSNNSGNADDGVIGTGTFAPGLNIVGINTDASGRKISFWGSLIQNQNNVGNYFTNTTVTGSFTSSGGNTNLNQTLSNIEGNVGVGTAAEINVKLYVKSNQDFSVYLEQTNNANWTLYSLGKAGGNQVWAVAS